jgi:hypothetical protein
MLLGALGAAACSDTSTAPRLSPTTASPLFSTTLEDEIQRMIDDLFPKGLETATEVRWETINRDLAKPDPLTARKHLNDLIKWVKLKTGEVTPPSGETRQQAAARLVLAMSIYLRDYPNGSMSSVPAVGGDATFEVVAAGAQATVVTPAEKAGVHIETGSTNEDRIIVVSEDPNPSFNKQCTGPLRTSRCQYPLFYKFESFPNPPMVDGKRGRFAVCLATKGERRTLEYPLEGGGEDQAVHEHVRLAKPKPGPGQPKTNGSVIEGDIEILPLVTDRPQLGFTKCERDIEYPAPTQVSSGLFGRAQRALFAAVDLAGRLITPKDLYAYDSGPEHWGLFGSPFNAVCYTNPDDTNEDTSVCRPDLSAASVSASSEVFGGDPLSVTYTIENRSRRLRGESSAASEPTSAALYLSLDPTLDPEDVSLGGVPACVPPAAPPASICITALSPDESQTITQAVTVPLVAGPRYLIISVAPNAGTKEVGDPLNANNVKAASILVKSKGEKRRDGAIAIYKNYDAWFGENKDELFLQAAPFNLVRDFGYSVRPMGELQSGIAEGTSLIIITSASLGGDAFNQISEQKAGFANLDGWVRAGGWLVIHAGDNAPGDGYTVPGLLGSRQTDDDQGCTRPDGNPFVTDLSLTTATHAFVRGPDATLGTADDLTNDKIDAGRRYSFCSDNHGSLAGLLPQNAEVLMVEESEARGSRPIYATYILGAGRVIVTTLTLEFESHEPQTLINHFFWAINGSNPVAALAAKFAALTPSFSTTGSEQPRVNTDGSPRP